MRILLAMILILLPAWSMGQGRTPKSKEALEADRRAIAETIKETEQQLAAIKNNKKASIGQLRALQGKLASRQRLISNINKELNSLNRDITASAGEVQAMQENIGQLQVSYAKSVRYAYITRSSYNMLAFLFSSRDFNEAIRRMKYMRAFRGLRKEQARQIAQAQVQLSEKIGTLNAEKDEQAQLLSEEVEQKKVLQDETRQASQVVRELKTKESKLRADIERNKKIRAKINSNINAILDRETARAQRAYEDDTRPVSKARRTDGPGTAVNDVRTAKRPRNEVELRPAPADEELAGSFEESRGRMAWPVDRGLITEGFGVHRHPVFKIDTDNPGIDIQTEEGARIRCVFRGRVSSVFSVSGADSKVVVVRHGSYSTVYNGLETVRVREGDELDARQVIGTVATNFEDQPVLSFQVWKVKGKQNIKLDPAQWLGKLR